MIIFCCFTIYDMPIEKIQSLIDQVSAHNGRNIKSTIENDCNNQLQQILWQDKLMQIMVAKNGIKQSLLEELKKKLEKEIWTEVINPQRETQQTAINRWEIQKVDRLPLNAKLHLLHHNSLMNNIQLAFCDPKDYVEFDSDTFVWINSKQIQDEIRRAIKNYLVINPWQAKALYTKLWLPVSLDNTQNLKAIIADAKTHTYTTSLKVWSFKEKTTPRITYIQWHPMLFGKNLVHVPYGHNATRAEKSKYDIDTSAKIFDDFYSLIRAHSHIQDSEQEGIQTLSELNPLFAQAMSIVKEKSKRKELEMIIEEIIKKLSPKKDSKLKKAEKQDLSYILDNHHTIRNDNKLTAAWKKIRERITSQQQIKNTVALQQNALYEDLAQQEVYARELIGKLQWHINNFKLKNRSARKIVQSYQDKLYTKPFFDLHDHVIQLEDQAKLEKWMPYTLKNKMNIDLLMQKSHITLLFLYNQYMLYDHLPQEKWFDNILKELRNNDITQEDKEKYLSPFIDILEKIKYKTIKKEDFPTTIQHAKVHMQQSRKSLLES